MTTSASKKDILLKSALRKFQLSHQILDIQ